MPTAVEAHSSRWDGDDGLARQPLPMSKTSIIYLSPVELNESRRSGAAIKPLSSQACILWSCQEPKETPELSTGHDLNFQIRPQRMHV